MNICPGITRMFCNYLVPEPVNVWYWLCDRLGGDRASGGQLLYVLIIAGLGRESHPPMWLGKCIYTTKLKISPLHGGWAQGTAVLHNMYNETWTWGARLFVDCRFGMILDVVDCRQKSKNVVESTIFHQWVVVWGWGYPSIENSMVFSYEACSIFFNLTEWLSDWVTEWLSNS